MAESVALTQSGHPATKQCHQVIFLVLDGTLVQLP